MKRNYYKSANTVKIILVIIFIISLCQTAVRSQERGVVNVSVKQNNGRKQEEILYRNSYALLIGNSDYAEWNNLPGVERDIPQIESVLRDKHGFDVEKALNLSKSELINRIDRFISRYGQIYDNRLLIYYAGHGYTAVLPDKRVMGYLVMKDAPTVPPVEEALMQTPKNLGDFRLQAVSMGEIENLAREIATRHALFVFDSCFSGTVLYRDNVVEIPQEISTEELEQMRGFLTAGNEKQRVRDDSPFRRAFIKGLEGRADINGDGFIFSSELGSFVKRDVYLETRNTKTPQSPVFGKQGNFSRGDMIFITPKKETLSPSTNNASSNRTKAALLANQAFSEMMNGNLKESEILANDSLRLDDNSAMAYGIRGWSWYWESDYKAARLDLEKAVRLDSSNMLFRASLALIYRKLKEKDLAKRTAEEALQGLIAPKTAIDYYARALVNHVLETFYDFDAISDYGKAIELDSKFALAYNNRGISYSDKKDYDAAIRDYTKAIRINPKFALAYSNRADAYYHKTDYDSAIQDYTIAIEIDPKGVAAYNNRGISYGNKKDYDSAIRDYSKAIEIDSKFALAYLNRGRIYSDQRKYYDAAIKDFSRVIELDPQNAFAYFKRGYTYGEKQNYDAEIQDYNKAIEINPKYAEAYYNRGNSYYVKKDYDSAIQDYSKIIEMNPKDAFAFHMRGISYSEKQNYDAAIRDYTKAIEIDPKGAAAYHNRGISYDNKKDYDSAIRDYSKAIELDPRYDAAYYNRGIAYSNKENHDAAIRDYTKAIEINPKYAEAYHNRGISYYNKEDYNSAIRDYSKAIEIAPKDADAYSNRALAYDQIGETAKAEADRRKYKELGGK